MQKTSASEREIEKKIEELEKILGVHFTNKELLRNALTHRSYLNENPGFSTEHNERLEFLGDSILELLVSECLFKELKRPEGEMTNLRAALVNSESLSEIAKELEIEKYLFLSRGEAKDTGRARASILANALEAIIGAIYLDRGIEETRCFVRNNILNLLKDVLEKKVIKDYKTQFQESAQEKYSITPSYKVLREWGPDHEKKFLVGVFLNKNIIAKGQGFSKQEAEEEAARIALKELK
ncbi:MAG: ribonuclease III [Patescibacteria group bacterium]